MRVREEFTFRYSDPQSGKEFVWSPVKLREMVTVNGGPEGFMIEFPVTEELFDRISRKTKMALFLAWIEFWKETHGL